MKAAYNKRRTFVPAFRSISLILPEQTIPDILYPPRLQFPAYREASVPSNTEKP